MNSVELRVQNMGHVPAFKNSKLLCRGRLITKPEYKKWMQRCVRSFESQLCSPTVTPDGAILTGHSLRLWIASSLPEDDCWTVVPEIHVKAVLVQKGNEGATITIERIT